MHIYEYLYIGIWITRIIMTSGDILGAMVMVTL